MRKMTIAAALAAVSMIGLSACKQETPTAMNTGSATAAAAGGIDGTWKADLASVQIDSKPDQYLVQNGKFECPTCTPPVSLAANGAFHPVTRPYADSMAVKIVDDHTVTSTAKKGDVVVGTTKYSVSVDGKTLTSEFTDTSVPNAPPVKGSTTRTRTADGPAGAHAMSGSWKMAKYNAMSDEGLTVTFKSDGDMLHMTSPSGVSYDAKVGGPDVPIKGDTANTMASVSRSGDSWVETDTRDGKVISVNTFTPGPDGKLHAVSESKLDGSTVRYTATKM